MGLVILGIAVVIGFWFGVEREQTESKDARRNLLKSRTIPGGEAAEADGGRLDDAAVRGSQRQPLKFRAKPVERAEVLSVLQTGKQSVDERVRQLQGMRGISLSKEERESALAFLEGKQVPEGMAKGSMHWLADELLTVMRLQEPPWEGLAAELGDAAFKPRTDPVVRDYIMQHLGHLWGQHGARKEIDVALWRAVDTQDETTPGTALIASSRGYARDQDEKSKEAVQERAMEFARDPDGALAVRVTALSIVGDGGGPELWKNCQLDQ